MSSGTDDPPGDVPRPPGEDAVKKQQLALDLGSPRPLFVPAAYIVSDSNRAAVAAARSFATSAEMALAICGPAASGKTHLAHIVAGGEAGVVRAAAHIEALHAYEQPLLVIDDAEACGSPKLLLALIEDRRARGWKTALAGRGRPRDWANGLRDLATRLEAMPRATLGEPDEGLMRAVIEQRFRDRQWRTSAGIAAYAAPRLPRTFAAAAAFVEAVGVAALTGARPINLALAREVLDSLSEGFPSA